MNRIAAVKIMDDRVYLKVLIAGDILNLRFYVPENKEAFVSQFAFALKKFAYAEPRYDWEEIDERYLHEDVIKNVIHFVHLSGCKNFLLTGVFQMKWVQFSDEGRRSYAVFMHNEDLKVEIIEVFPSLEAALLKILEWQRNDKNVWMFKRPVAQRMAYDVVIWDFLYSIDTLGELIQYKNLHEDQFAYLEQKGLISIPK